MWTYLQLRTYTQKVLGGKIYEMKGKQMERKSNKDETKLREEECIVFLEEKLKGRKTRLEKKLIEGRRNTRRNCFSATSFMQEKQGVQTLPKK